MRKAGKEEWVSIFQAFLLSCLPAFLPSSFTFFQETGQTWFNVQPLFHIRPAHGLIDDSRTPIVDFQTIKNGPRIQSLRQQASKRRKAHPGWPSGKFQSGPPSTRPGIADRRRRIHPRTADFNPPFLQLVPA
jgi:hypothetical protein